MGPSTSNPVSRPVADPTEEPPGIQGGANGRLDGLMSHSDLGLLVLHALRLAGFADAGNVADRLLVDRARVEEVLADAAVDGLARHRSGARSGWSLTDEGRKENERLLAEELDAAGRRHDVEGVYRRFLPINAELLVVCTDWQVLDAATGTLNDHTDADHDRSVIDRLGRIDGAAQPLCAELGSWFERYASYGPRLAHAIDRVRAGDGDWFTRPTLDSYHTVWFELHEDLLATLGLDRTSEPARTPTQDDEDTDPKEED